MSLRFGFVLGFGYYFSFNHCRTSFLLNLGRLRCSLANFTFRANNFSSCWLIDCLRIDLI